MRKAWIIGMLVLILAQPAMAFTVSSSFGWRKHPVTGKRHFHRGIDIPARRGTIVVALFAGEVILANRRRGYGNTVLLNHGNHVYTLYGHCARILVKSRQKVAAGEAIATVGSTGIATGDHLHLEYWVNHHYVDPLTIFQSQGNRARDKPQF
jgi:murein DD-endopeptidase MepM/ murein hydrolase activator NlpD